jgi:DNA polymerase-3 subunit delta'
MSARDDAIEPLLPRQTQVLFGHSEAEQAFLDAYRAGRMPHAWLIGGPRGIGKATLAYRMARFVLAHAEPAVPAVRRATSLALEPDHPVARRVAAQGHPDLLVVERTVGDNDKLRTLIAVDDVRRTIGFFGSTAGEGGWRVCIVDAADELNAAGANALLKILEEPPEKALLVVVSHAPGRLLPTIRSRCRRLALRPLSAEDVAWAASAAVGREASGPELERAAAASDGSVARAIELLGGKALDVREKVTALLGKLPAVDPRDLHALGDTLGRDESSFTAFVDTVRDWLSAKLAAREAPGRLAAVAEAWERVNRAARDVEVFNLERKPFVFNVFGWLAEASRG